MELPQLERDIRARTLKRLETIAARLRTDRLKISVAAEWDFPGYEAIVRRASKIKADLIVASIHPGRHIAAGLLHLTDWELLRLSQVPVLLMKTTGRYKRPVVLAAVDPGHTFAKPAQLDTQILRAGSAITNALHGTLHALHAYAPIPLNAQSSDVLNADTVERLSTEAAAQAQRGFDRILQRTRIAPTRRHLVVRYPIDAIQQTAREIHSSIVVMGAISRSGLKRLFVGNTAERVLDQLECDVLIVKPTNFANRVPRTTRGVRLVAVASGSLPF